MQSNEHCDPMALSEYAAGMRESATLVAAHVAECARCQEQLEALRRLDGLLSQVMSGSEPEDGVDTVYPRARAAALAEREARWRSDRLWRAVSRHWRTGLAGVTALAASILLVLIHLPSPSDDRPTEVSGAVGLLSPKGQGPGPAELQTALPAAEEVFPPSLSFSVLDVSGKLSRGRRDERYATSSQLYFRVDLPTDGHLLLIHLHEGRLEPLMPASQGPESLTVPQGAWELAEGSQLLSLPLAELAGYHRFVVLFAKRPFGLSAPLRDALLTGLDAASIYRVFGLRSDAFQVQVQDESLR